MNSASKLILITSLLLAACSQEPQKEARNSPVYLPVGNINASILPSSNPINEIKNYSNTQLVINSNRLFQQSDMPLRTTNFQKYSSRLVNNIIQHLKAYPDTTHIDIKVYRYGNFPPAYLQQLSSQQAQTVAALLWDYGNISPDRITFSGMGNLAPKISHDDSFAARSQNNRIEITILKGV